MVAEPRLTFRIVNIAFIGPYLSHCQYCLYRTVLVVLSILPLYVNIYRIVSTVFIGQYLLYCQYCLYRTILILLQVLPL
jgi:hypothetical protein